MTCETGSEGMLGETEWSGLVEEMTEEGMKRKGLGGRVGYPMSESLK